MTIAVDLGRKATQQTKQNHADTTIWIANMQDLSKTVQKLITNISGQEDKQFRGRKPCITNMRYSVDPD